MYLIRRCFQSCMRTSCCSFCLLVYFIFFSPWLWLVSLNRHADEYSSKYSIVVVQLLNHVWLFVTPWTAACHIPLSFTISQSLLKFMSIETVMLSNLQLFLCHPLLLLPCPSQHQYSKGAFTNLQLNMDITIGSILK